MDTVKSSKQLASTQVNNVLGDTVLFGFKVQLKNYNRIYSGFYKNYTIKTKHTCSIVFIKNAQCMGTIKN